VPALKFLSIYTPSNHEPEMLEQLLVARNDLLDRTVSKLEAAATSKARHHQLIVGPRGIGKTHFVSLVHHRLLTGPHSDRFVLAWLREDAWGLRTFDKLIERVLAAAGAPATGDMPPVERLRTFVGDRTLVIIVENLDDVFARIKAEGQRSLRSLIQEWGQVVLMAATPSLFNGVASHDEPFYGFFEITHLEELTLEDAAELLARVGDLRGTPAMRAVVTSPRGLQRLRVIQALAGGHPRIWMLFADCLDIEELDELVPQFLKALDDLTPYYQDRMRDLEGQQETIVAVLCEQRGALTVKELARLCEINEKTGASQLFKLEEKGYVRRVRLDPSLGTADGRESYYELREPLMRLCLDVKDAHAKPIRLIVEFLRGWFEESDDRIQMLFDSPGITGQYVRAAFVVGATPASEIGTEVDRHGERIHHVVAFRMKELLAFSGVTDYDETLKRAYARAEPGSWNLESALTGSFVLAMDTVKSIATFEECIEEILSPPHGVAWHQWRTNRFRVITDAAAELGITRSLGSGLVTSVPAFLGLSDDAAEEWVSGWNAASADHEGMTIGLRILNAADAWRRDGKRTHLMRLPKEERDILIPLLPKKHPALTGPAART
jgi:DNA-binding MarR family transcriptional regulator